MHAACVRFPNSASVAIKKLTRVFLLIRFILNFTVFTHTHTYTYTLTYTHIYMLYYLSMPADFLCVCARAATLKINSSPALHLICCIFENFKGKKDVICALLFIYFSIHKFLPAFLICC